MDPGTSKLGVYILVYANLCIVVHVHTEPTIKKAQMYSVSTSWLLVHHESICFLGISSNSFVDSNVTTCMQSMLLQNAGKQFRVFQRGDAIVATRLFVRGAQEPK